MANRKFLAVANWKMNFSLDEALSFAKSFHVQKVLTDTTKVVICAPFPYLYTLHQTLDNISIGSQDVSRFESGAYTGDVSAFMLHSVGVSYAIVGHSERREYFNEQGQVLIDKITRLHKYHITPIFCVGECIATREKDEHFSFVTNQLDVVSKPFTAEQVAKWVIAYEPVWAIGTGKTASPQQAEDMHAHIRSYFETKYDKGVADNLSILYGGSVKPENAKELFSCQNIDGGLMGGASLQADAFAHIVEGLHLAKKI